MDVSGDSGNDIADLQQARERGYVGACRLCLESALEKMGSEQVPSCKISCISKKIVPLEHTDNSLAIANKNNKT